MRADDLAADEALTVDDVSLRPALGVIELCGGLGRVADRGQVHVMANEKTAVGVRVLIDADGEDSDVGPIVVQLEQRGHLHDAWRAPGSPEVEQYHAAPVAGQVNGSRAVGEIEIRGWLAGQGRVHATVTTGHQGQRQKQSERKEPRKPHISIILSVSLQ